MAQECGNSIPLLDDKGYCELVAYFWSLWQSLSSSEVFASPLDWWDEGKFYMWEVTQFYCCARCCGFRGNCRALHCTRPKGRRFVLGDNGLRRVRPLPLFSSIWPPNGMPSRSCTQSTTQLLITSIMIHLNFFGVWQQCNQGLFTAEPCDRASQDALLSKLTRQLSLAEQASCEGPLALDKFLSPVSDMASGNTPGSHDGFPMEF